MPPRRRSTIATQPLACPVLLPQVEAEQWAIESMYDYDTWRSHIAATLNWMANPTFCPSTCSSLCA